MHSLPIGKQLLHVQFFRSFLTLPQNLWVLLLLLLVHPFETLTMAIVRVCCINIACCRVGGVVVNAQSPPLAGIPLQLQLWAQGLILVQMLVQLLVQWLFVTCVCK